MVSLPDTYISKVDFNTVVGDLNTLLLNNINISSEIEDINDRLKWKEI